MLEDLVKNNRSYRRFYQDTPVNYDTLKELVNLARLSPSAANKQPLKYVLSNEAEKNALIFDTLQWAGYLQDWPGPAEGERPSAYIIVLKDPETSIPFSTVDIGIACQSILLGAVEKGLGGCILGAVNREKLKESMQIPGEFEIAVVIAIGKPRETVVIEPAGDDIKYWRDAEGVHHVPKRALEDIIL